jgi:hypothetical protein
MYVSSYEEAFRKAFDQAIEQDALRDRTDVVKKLTDTLWEEVASKIRESIDTWLMDNIKDDICREAAKVAESMLSNAIAGDDKELRNLFGFNDWYMKHAYIGRMPTQWALLDVIIKRHPDLFTNEKIAQQETELTMLRADLARLREYHRERGF